MKKCQSAKWWNGIVLSGIFVPIALVAGGGEVRFEPGVPVVPANHLKFYLHFSGPMERGDVFRYLRLVEVDTGGREIAEVPEPFREVELWDETFTRLTLWFHPGRQKPGVNLNVEIGPILEKGGRYRLEISEKWRMESGETLTKGSTHLFSAGAFDDIQPDPGTWRIEAKPEGVWIYTGEELDPESLKKRISVSRDKGKELPAIRVVAESDGFWIRHGEGWESGSYRLVVDPALEDLAGNSVARPFNLDLEKAEGTAEVTGPVTLPFTVP